MNNKRKKKYCTNSTSLILAIIIAFSLTSFSIQDKHSTKAKSPDKHPRIVNIINFIRLLEPRDVAVTEDVLYQTVVKQIELMNKNKLGGTFLLQYDALLDSRYQKLLKSLPDSSFEIGGWWEIPQPLVENAGLKWRGRYPWDWHADVGFATGYSPEEREKLVDVYMKDFKRIFGYYPKSVGSWFIDAHTLNYMHEKYGLVASCICRDQIGTDGYTLWGGYWNQAYYPSKINSYMPAQNESNQVSVPVFRMLGSDPVPQYSNTQKIKRQGNFTLEPAYSYTGADSTWVNFYFKMFTEGECMEFNYVQVGQENSFTWAGMSKGLELQLPLVAKLRDEGKLQVETLAKTGHWFHDRYQTTPATSVTVKEDLPGSDIKTVWFDSRFFRTNLLWEKGTLRFTDVHLFDENFPNDYETKKGTSNQCFFYTLPFIDGYTKTADKIAGLQLKAMVDGKKIVLEGKDPIIDDSESGKLHITWPLTSVKGNLIIDINEGKIKLKLESKEPVDWFLDLDAKDNEAEFLKTITAHQVDCQFKEMRYSVTAIKGSFIQPEKEMIFRIIPNKNTVILDLSRKNN